MTPHHVRPDHHPLPTGSRDDGIGHDGTVTRPPKQSTAPPGLWAPAPEVVARKATEAPKKRYRATVTTGRPSRAKPPHERKVKPVVCGTDSGYKKHLRDKTPTCTPCREAHNVTVRAYDRNRVRKQYVRPDCGTEAGYQAHRTRKERICDPCRLAHNDRQRARRRTRAAAEGKQVRTRQTVAACGTSSGYKRHRRNGEDACLPCLVAKRTDDAAYEARKRAA